MCVTVCMCVSDVRVYVCVSVIASRYTYVCVTVCLCV